MTRAARAVRLAGDLPHLGRLSRTRRRRAVRVRGDAGRLTFPYLMLISLASLLGGILNSLHKFWVAAAAPILLNVAQIVALLFFHTHEPLSTTQVPGDLGHRRRRAAARLARARLLGEPRPAQAQACRRINADVKRLMKLIGPAAAGAGAVQFNLVVSTALATGLLPHGSVSYIYYADRLNQLPLGLIGIGLGTVLASDHFAPARPRRRRRGDGHAEPRARAGAVLHSAGDGGAGHLRRADHPGLFQHGHFDAIDAVRTGQALAAFSIGLPSYILVKVLTPGYYARHDTKTPMRYAMISHRGESGAQPGPDPAAASMSARRWRRRSPRPSTSGCSTIR